MEPHSCLRSLLAAFFLCLTCFLPAYSQGGKEVTVSGKVVDRQREPLPGAVVLLNGTLKGVMVAEDGSYSITVPKNGTLDVSLMGYSTVSENVDGRKEINFVLKEDNIQLKEAVVEVGYGSERVNDVTGSVANFDIDNFDAGAMSFDESLQGRLAGVLVTGGDGQPGSELDMVIRGGGSLTQSNAPLYVVDGFPMEDFSAASVNSSDIASISVLKDASATAIYGSRGSNGVVIIQTKAGTLGKPSISYDGTTGILIPRRTIELMTPLEFVEYQIERNPSANTAKYLTNEGRDLDYYRTCEDIDWQGRLFREAPFQKHSVSLIGGNRQTRYQTSVSYTGQDGIIENSGIQRYQGRFSLEQKINNRMRVFVQGSFFKNTTFGQSTSAQMADGRSYSNYLMYRIWGAIPVLTGGRTLEDLFDENSDASFLINPVVSNANEDIRTDTRQFSINGRVEYMLNKRFKFKTRAGYTYTGTENHNFYNSKTYVGYTRATNSYGVQGNLGNRHSESWLFENMVDYARGFGKAGRVAATFGLTAQAWNNHNFRVSAVQVEDDTIGIAGIDSGIMQNPVYTSGESRMLSALMRVNYRYRNRYLFTLTTRADGSSRFAPGHRWGVFPSGSFAWRFGQEKKIRRIKWIEDAKLRFSYGLTGNNRVGDFLYSDAISLGNYYGGWGGVAPGRIAAPVRLGNKNLTWEKATQADLGLDLYTFGSRLNLKLDLYRKESADLLLNAPVPASSGYASTFRNSGSVRNSGLEITLTTVNIRKRNFMWTSEFNITFQKDKVLSLYDGVEELFSTTTFNADFRSTDLYVARVGGPVASFWGLVWDGCYGYDDFTQQSDGSWLLNADVPTNGNPREMIQPGDIKYVDRNGDLVCDERDRTVIGRCAPIHYGGLSNTFTWKNWTLSVLLQWNYGNDIMNVNRYIFEGNYADSTINQYRSYVDRWSDDNPSSRNFRVGGAGPRGVYSSRTIEDGSYLRLKSVKLAYKLPMSLLRKIRVKSAQVYVSGFNLVTWCNYSGFDPEVSIRKTALTPGLDYCSYPRSRNWSGGLKVSF